MAPRMGISEIPGTVSRTEVMRRKRLEAAPNRAVEISLVRKVVRAVARMLMTTPLMTWLALNFTHSTAWTTA